MTRLENDPIARALGALAAGPLRRTNETDTEAEAADHMENRVARLQSLVMAWLRSKPQGSTADEIAAGVGQDRLAIRPRVSELHNAGYIKDTGLRRKNRSGRSAIVWEIA